MSRCVSTDVQCAFLGIRGAQHAPKRSSVDEVAEIVLLEFGTTNLASTRAGASARGWEQSASGFEQSSLSHRTLVAPHERVVRSAFGSRCGLREALTHLPHAHAATFIIRINAADTRRMCARGDALDSHAMPCHAMPCIFNASSLHAALSDARGVTGGPS